MSGALLEEEPAEPGAPDPMGDEEWAERVACEEEFEIPADEISPGDQIPASELAALMAEAREITAGETRAARLLGADVTGLAGARRRGPGLSGAMREGEYPGPLGFMAHGGAGDT